MTYGLKALKWLRGLESMALDKLRFRLGLASQLVSSAPH